MNPPEHHVIPVRTYLRVWLALMVLTALTVGAAQINLGAWNVPLALAIASIKALLVALIFMHLLYDDRFNAVVLSIGFLWALIFISMTVTDQLDRGALDPIESSVIKQPELYGDVATTASAATAPVAAPAASGHQ